MRCGNSEEDAPLGWRAPKRVSLEDQKAHSFSAGVSFARLDFIGSDGLE